ncbi:MAG: hypothetical protein IJN89_02615, partial [Anaerotignum sp.]|nr:hypothetical protein [Anaerotignum sp.]
HKEEIPYVQETVFQKKPSSLETKKREPIFDFVKEKEREANLKAAAEKYVAETSSNAMKAAASMMADSALRSVQMKEESVLEPAAEEPVVQEMVEEPVQEMPVYEQPEIDEAAPIIDIAGVDEATLMPQKAVESVEDEIPIVEMEEMDVLQTEPAAEDVPVDSEMDEPAEGAAAEKKAEDIPEAEIPTEPVEVEKPYIYPPIELLGADPQTGSMGNRAEMIENAKKLESTLKSFGVEAKVIQISKGPTVTRYELSPSQGVKVSKIVNLADDIALNLAASGIRIEAPIPGKAAVGIEVPNKETQSVYMRTILESDAFKEHESKLAFALGQDIAGNPVVTDIAKMPHLLIAGATGSGKSVCINTLITSILYKADPKEVKLLLVDPKVVELSVYNGIPHLLIPVVTDPKKASSALNWAVREMLQRYNDFAAHGVRDIKGFNKMMEENIKMIVSIDDIDRLSEEEIIAVFQLVKALADFPNTVYILAFDYNVVVHALSKVQYGDGKEYLEKIIQVPFEIPAPSIANIHEALFSKLNSILGDIPEERWAKTTWAELFQFGLQNYIKSIRDVIRYTNVFLLKYELLKDETDPVDLLGLTALQVFEPSLYSKLPSYKDILCGADHSYSYERQKADEEKVKKSVSLLMPNDGTITNEDAANKILGILFPRTKTATGISYSIGRSYSHRDFIINNNIATPECFDRYFALTLENDAIPTSVMKHIIYEASEGEFTAEM